MKNKIDITLQDNTNLRLLDKIRKSGKSLGQIANEMGFRNASRVHQVLHNYYPVPEKTKEKFANYFNCSIGELFNES